MAHEHRLLSKIGRERQRTPYVVDAVGWQPSQERSDRVGVLDPRALAKIVVISDDLACTAVDLFFVLALNLDGDRPETERRAFRHQRADVIDLFDLILDVLVGAGTSG